MGGICSWEKGNEASDKARRPVKRPNDGEDISQKTPGEKTVEKLSDKNISTMADHTTPLTLDAYNAERASVLAIEREEGFDGRARETASELQNKANEIIVAIRQRDAELVHGGGLDMLGKVMTPDKHFVGNASNITNTSLFKIAQQMPKGAHLHCHFNSCLPPQFLLRHAKNNAHMYIKSDLALNSEDNKERAEIQFQMHVIDEEKHLEPTASLLHESYKSSFHADDKRKGWYSYDKFLQEYPGGESAAEEWLASKLLFTEDEVYGISQTTANIWLRFGTRTRMLKGLFGHETAFRAYTDACIQDFIRDNIQYAEIRPNFPSNSLVKSDATGFIDNVGLLQIIADAITAQRQSGVPLTGLKVIYCCPRSFSKERVAASLVECIALKKKFPDLICGYDLVGGEEAGFPLQHFAPELLSFRATCISEGLDIPFLLHAGETLDSGSSTDANLLDAILLGAKRIGHGFALPKHPKAMRMVKERGIALEICPISNEVLHLCPSIRGHALPVLLANNVHCTINSDNGTFYGSSLSHDFYQIMVGAEAMSLHGWRVLAEWSLEHSCLTPSEKVAAKEVWLERWNVYCQWIVDTYGDESSAKGPEARRLN
ncbi:hypothetical protein VE01_08253 [Pseudogymnoascus verrucosus]|uniref:adenosine deaminase n=1 Tax=Pseudogymnoascus verrucosus TaxID=342668 RepID=A0A1B8GDM6_9PEZI|nr:uncharacterized protein VE01_08253 [Pseudogymnoascus verrucosus]OBT93927.1 hypothetical protein VE01_08253 [Pseudogymnoascus verrucosus]